MSEQNLILQAILSEITENPPPVEISEEEIVQIIKILEKNQFRINRSHCRDKITRIVNRIIEG